MTERLGPSICGANYGSASWKHDAWTKVCTLPAGHTSGEHGQWPLGKPYPSDDGITVNPQEAKHYKALPWPARILFLAAFGWVVFSFWALPLYLIGVWKP